MIENKLKEIRMKEYCMSSSEFAAFLEVDIRRYSTWELNKSRPTLESALEVAKQLNKTIEEIWFIK